MKTENNNRVRMLGLCGMGVGPLAIYMHQSGWEVSGKDDAPQPPMSDFLHEAGIKFEDDFDPKNPPAIVGHSNAVKPENPQYAAAKSAGARLVLRGELLAECVREKQLVAVCGSHGKTTTSGMLIQSLLAAGEDIGYVLGGLYRDASLPPAHAAGDNPWVVCEVDESDGTIKHFSPEITLVVNLDWDHPDYYKTEADLEKTFADLFARTKRAIFIPEKSERLARLAAGAKVPVFTVGEDGNYSVRVVSGKSAETRVELCSGFPTHGEITLPVAGRFNIFNAAAALAVTAFITNRIGTEPLGKFSGIRRRQDVLFESGGLRVMADYAHHPTEIGALLRYLRESTLGKIVAVFQPHRFSRTLQYAGEFASSLAIGDNVFLMPVYSAGEPVIEAGKTVCILNAVPENEKEKFALIDDEAALLARLENFVPGNAETTVVFIGAGNIDRTAANFVSELWLTGARANTQTRELGERVRPLLSKETLLEKKFPLASKTTLGAGGNALWYAEPATQDDLRLLLRAAVLSDLPVFALGRGSNLLVPDDGFRGLVIRLANPVWQKISVQNDGTLLVGAGARLKEIAARAANAGLAGFEFSEGIPGSLGGALSMNAGAMGASIFDRVQSVTWVSPDGTTHKQTREFFTATGYRNCPELNGAIALSAVLKSTGNATPETIFQTIKTFADARREAQPREPSAGCSFRNPPGNTAGALIDKLNLKGLKVGGAQVSPVHANFIVNTGGATAGDVIELIRRVRGVVKASHGIALEPEIVLLGKEWKDVL